MFHVSLLREWKAADVQEDRPVLQDDIPEIEEPYWEIEKILRWRKFKLNKKIIKQYLILWRGFQLKRSHGLLKNNSSDRNYSSNLYKKTSLLKRNCE